MQGQKTSAEAGADPVRVVRFSPKYAVFASGGSDVVLWLPENKQKREDEEDEEDDEDMEIDTEMVA